MNEEKNTRRKKPGCTLGVVLVVVLLMTAVIYAVHVLSEPSDPPHTEGALILMNLRGMKEAALTLHEDNRYILSKLPKGLNILEYLLPYPPYPYYYPTGTIKERGHFFITSDNQWWVGYDLQYNQKGTMHNLADRARTVPLFGTSEPEPPLFADETYRYKEGEPFVWMSVTPFPEPIAFEGPAEISILAVKATK